MAPKELSVKATSGFGRIRTFGFVSVTLFALALALPSAQTPPAAAPASSGGKKALTLADYSRWRTITGQQMSPDGKWVAYGLALTNVPTAETKPVLTILNIE